MNKRVFSIILSCFMILGLVGGSTQVYTASDASNASKEVLHITSINGEQTRNLQKLCKVWGFAKYTHQAFLTGEKNWDDELLKLIPVIQNAREADVNGILYEWFVSLGDDGYDTIDGLYALALSNEIKYTSEQGKLDVDRFVEQIEETPWLSLTQMYLDYNAGSFLLRLEKDRWLDLQEMVSNLAWISSISLTSETNTHQMADKSWISKDYLGRELYGVLSRFKEISITDPEKAPVSFDELGRSNFANEESCINMEYNDSNYRLLGLFRLWNAIEYYFPYKDIMDEDWNELLYEFIPVMLEETDWLCYESTIARITSKLHDAHLHFKYDDRNIHTLEFIFGSYYAPIRLTEAEGRIVVSEKVRANEEQLFQVEPGDIILKLNGKDIYEVIEDIKQYISYPNDKKAMAYLNKYSFLS